MAKQKLYSEILGDGLRDFRKRTGKTQAEVSFSLNDGKPCNVGTYRNIEGGTRPAGFIPFRKMAKYFLKVKDIKTVKALLSYANLDPKDLLPILVADAWIPVGDSLPRGYTKLPVNHKHVNITYIRYEGGKEHVTSGHCIKGGHSPQGVQWDLYGYGNIEETDDGFKIIAWQPLPEPASLPRGETNEQ